MQTCIPCCTPQIDLIGRVSGRARGVAVRGLLGKTAGITRLPGNCSVTGTSL